MMRRLLARMAATAALGLALVAAPAIAGRDCMARRPTTEAMARDLALAASVATQLDALAEREGLRIALLARAGQDLSKYGLRHSHLGIVYRDDDALAGRGAWRVVHKLNHCQADDAAVYRQGLAEFFGEGLTAHEAGLVILRGPFDNGQTVARLKDNRTMLQLHEPRYNMLAYPWSGPYQQSNQWALETLAMLADADVVTRSRARQWLRLRGYQPTTLHVSAAQRLAADFTMAHISFSDHPFGRRMAGQIDTVTVDSVFAFVQRNRLGDATRVLRSEPVALVAVPRAKPVPPPPVPEPATLPRASERT